MCRIMKGPSVLLNQMLLCNWHPQCKFSAPSGSGNSESKTKATLLLQQGTQTKKKVYVVRKRPTDSTTPAAELAVTVHATIKKETESRRSCCIKLQKSSSDQSTALKSELMWTINLTIIIFCTLDASHDGSWQWQSSSSLSRIDSFRFWGERCGDSWCQHRKEEKHWLKWRQKCECYTAILLLSLETIFGQTIRLAESKSTAEILDIEDDESFQLQPAHPLLHWGNLHDNSSLHHQLPICTHPTVE